MQGTSFGVFCEILESELVRTGPRARSPARLRPCVTRGRGPRSTDWGGARSWPVLILVLLPVRLSRRRLAHAVIVQRRALQANRVG